MGLTGLVLWLGGLAVGGIAGYAVQVWRARRAAKERRRIPKHWPLDARSLANSEECRVWRWLGRVFFDHQVMVKVPVTRFTFPRAEESSAYWFELLSGVYCTFTVCAADGHVFGCIDVPTRSGLSRSNQKLKLALLSQCGIAYWVVQPGSLPSLEKIRRHILGDAIAGGRGKSESHVQEARQHLRAAIDRQRLRRQGAEAPAQVRSRHELDSSLLSDSGFHSSGWQQPNSFIAPLDSRPAKLF